MHKGEEKLQQGSGRRRRAQKTIKGDKNVKHISFKRNRVVGKTIRRPIDPFLNYVDI